MIKRLLVLAAVGLMAAILAVGAGAVGDPFAGAWIGHDPAPPAGDGSTNYMAIGRPATDGSRKWLYYETDASGFCAGGPLAAVGTGRSVGAVLTVTVTRTRCANGSPGGIPRPFDITFVATQDGRLDGGGGVFFTRVGVS